MGVAARTGIDWTRILVISFLSESMTSPWCGRPPDCPHTNKMHMTVKRKLVDDILTELDHAVVKRMASRDPSPYKENQMKHKEL